ncbi:MAG TPA: c-type cytochrome [Candidatus Sulfotelmatobacter sp.]|jgi:mono/diheme cytochrome c family protein|nr:c-type cytochrome [Candidatus Sulfotelmatobacter sp.]
MNRFASGVLILSVAALAASCSRKPDSAALKPTAFGAAMVESSGGKQFGQAATPLPQPVVVQVNDEQGAAVTGALVEFAAAPGVTFDPASALTDSSGQATTNVALGGMAGRYQIAASTLDKTHKKVELKMEEIALGYQQTLGRRLNEQYCDRCHNAESTAERVSNYDNLEVKPHPFTEGETLNKLSDADLTAIITYGGPALNKSALMPAWGNTLKKADVQALIAYIRAVSDPPSRSAGPVYAKN